MSITICEFQSLAFGYEINGMQTVSETRRARLEILIKRYGGVMELNEAMGWTRTDPKLSQIRNENIRSGRDKPYQMGDKMARDIEKKLSIERGWMDTPPNWDELLGQEDPRAKAFQLLEQMSAEQAAVATRLLTAIAEPEKKQGNGG
jgi:hypothetical protein